MIKFVYAICPVLVIYVKNPPKGYLGFSYGPLIKIQRDHKDDTGLLEHELTHSKQWYRSLGLWWLLYRFKKLRYKYEIEAYAVQLSYAPIGAHVHYASKYVEFICERYGLDLDKVAVMRDLLAAEKRL